MTLADLQPFSEALKLHANRAVLPTLLDSAQLRQSLDAATRRQSFFSAETMFGNYLEQLKADVEDILNPQLEQREDRVTAENPQGNVTTGINPATARLRAKELLQRIGYSPAMGEAGTIKDLSSDARINLVIKTNTELAQGAGAFIQGQEPGVLEAFPCWELYRLEDRKTQRNWAARWRLCAQIVGDVDAARVQDQTGRMVARKDSPIWQALGDGADGSDDTLGNPYPPFAFNSGMWTRDVSYEEAEGLGLVNLQTRVESQLPDDLAQLFGRAA
jgi:hypothetical protein